MSFIEDRESLASYDNAKGIGPMKFVSFICGTILFSTLSSTVFGHGEDKPGPHGGFIRMPGPFHTELVKVSDTTFRVYLLDMEWKNPTTRDSKIAVKAKSKKGFQPVSCAFEVEAFKCELPKNWKWSDVTEISIEPTRQGTPGGVALYRFPKTGYD